MEDTPRARSRRIRREAIASAAAGAGALACFAGAVTTSTQGVAGLCFAGVLLGSMIAVRLGIDAAWDAAEERDNREHQAYLQSVLMRQRTDLPVA